MYDPKFEKAIQQKMEELEFRPPESVWVNIEKAVVVNRRRRIGFLWRYLLPAVFVAAAAGLYWKATRPGGMGNAGRRAASVRAVDKGSRATTDNGGTASADNGGTSLAGGTTADNSGTGSSAAGGATGDADNLRPGSPKASAGHNEQEGHVPAGETFAAGGTTANGHTGFAGHRATGGHSATTGNQEIAGHTASASHTGIAGHPASAGGSSFAGETSLADQTPGLGETTTAGQAGSAGRGPTVGQKGPDAWFYVPGLADLRLIPQVQASSLSSKKTGSVVMAGLSHPQRHWEAGFVAGGGLSRLNRLNSEQARNALDPSTTSFYTFSNPSASSSHYISDVRPEASFVGGIYLQRPLGDRWIINTGMNLHYYSNRITVGQQVTTYVNSSVSYLAAAVQTTSITSMYSAGDTRSVINKYYFLELPVGIQWKVNKSHLLPIFVEGGVSLSRLMGASALFYNAKTGLYSKDGDIVNKTQFNLESALLVGLPLHGIDIQLGPQIQYGLTPLVNTQGVGDQHILYTGIRVVIIPGRK